MNAIKAGDTVRFKMPSMHRYGLMDVLILKAYPGKEWEGDKAWVHFHNGAAGVNAIYDPKKLEVAP